MNAVEIEQAVSELFARSFDAKEFPYAFLQAFGNKETTIKRLRKGDTNKSDLGGVLQSKNIHIGIAPCGKVDDVLEELNESAATERYKARFTLATDGESVVAEDRESDTGATVACDYADLPNHFGFFLPLAGISTVATIRENSFDIRATSRLNKLYIELLKDNPDWAGEQQRHEMNHFMARLIFCFFAEDTNIFNGDALFTDTLIQMGDDSNTHEIIHELFRAMNTPLKERSNADLRPWADAFPYVNGGLFDGDIRVPRISKLARSYLRHIGGLDWTKINPDIFGSMIQAIADDDERGQLGMHYTSVPNILRVLNPLFLDELRAKLEQAGNNKAKLRNLRKRLAHIRIFDPACGSGNFLVIAYKEMRAIEAEINQRLGESNLATTIPTTNFRGIELRDFSAEIARLALIIAEYQCNALYRGFELARLEFLPLSHKNWITCANALHIDWLKVCPPTGTGVKITTDDLFATPLNQAEIDFANEGGETYICGNPPYLGSTWQDKAQKAELEAVAAGRIKSWKSLDYVSGWFIKAADYAQHTKVSAAFVATNSICQGQQVAVLWPFIFQQGCHIASAYTSFKWANLASHNAGVTVIIVTISNDRSKARYLYSLDEHGKTQIKEAANINAYLINGADVIVQKVTKPLSDIHEMLRGNQATDGGYLLLTPDEVTQLQLNEAQRSRLIRRFYGSEEFIHDKPRYCLWIEDNHLDEAMAIPAIAQRIEGVRQMRLNSRKKATNEAAQTAHRFDEVRQQGNERTIIIPRVSSENRDYLPVGITNHQHIIGDRNFALYDAPLWNMALIASRLHWVWIATVCVRLRTDFSYSNTLGWNTFPVPKLTESNKDELTRCAENILLAREIHYPATIADLYKADAMPDNLRAAHEYNDDVLERIYIGRRFKNDSERLEKLFAMYADMVSKKGNKKGKRS